MSGTAHLKQHDPRGWTPQPDGSWLSPRKQRWRGDSATVRRVRAARAALGIVDPPEETP